MNFTASCCQAEEEELKKLEKSAIQHEKLLATQAGLLWLTHYISILKCPLSITQWRIFSSSVVHVGNVVCKESWKCQIVLVISNHMFIRNECYITDGILHFAQRVGTQTRRYWIQVCRRKYMNSSTGLLVACWIGFRVQWLETLFACCFRNVLNSTWWRIWKQQALGRRVTCRFAFPSAVYLHVLEDEQHAANSKVSGSFNIEFSCHVRSTELSFQLATD